MRRLFTTEEAARAGMSRARLRWGAKKGKWRSILWGVYGMGGEAPTPLETGIAAVMATGGVASGRVAGALLGLDSVNVTGPDVTVPPGSNGHRRGVRRRVLAPERAIEVPGVRCTDGLQTLVDLAGCPGIDDLVWEQAMESALRLKLVSIEALQSYDRRVPGRARMRRVLGLRPPGVAPTGSLLETLMVQLARTVPGLPPPVRQ